jgi:SAM-dependent methyltransferase
MPDACWPRRRSEALPANSIHPAAFGTVHERVYANRGNAPLLGLLSPGAKAILDVGCGAGDNAAALKSINPGCAVYGITFSAREAAIARRFLDNCWVLDVEQPLPSYLCSSRFDAIILSHVLEHLRDPAKVLESLVPLLREGGEVLIAVPNILVWRMRLHFLTGRFEYDRSGALDDTHLRFFTYDTADRYLLARSDTLRLTTKAVSASVPLWWLRRVLPRGWVRALDGLGGRLRPNLFGDQVLLRAVKVGASPQPQNVGPPAVSRSVGN